MSQGAVAGREKHSETPTHNKKRKARQAFQDPNEQESQSVLQRHRPKSITKPSKVITFSDGRDGEEDGPIANGPSSLTNSPSVDAQSRIPGKLKQRATELLKRRQHLPIWSHADEIRNKVLRNDVLLLVGETGSGKSTQIPQFLLPLCQKTSAKNGFTVGGRIAITQPRRVAAISLARRVAEEVGTPLGKTSPASQVGYSVRFDSNTSPSTRIKFVTDGTLLQEFMRDPWLKEYSVVVVDEVHERGVNVDLVLGFLKRMIDGRNKTDGRGGVPLKVVVMSATADMDRIQEFFARDRTGVSTDLPIIQQEAGANELGNSSLQLVSASQSGTKLASCHIKGRQYPVKIHYIPFPVSNVLDATLERITDIHTHAPLPGDVLVFLPGQETIDALESMCIAYAQTLITKSKEKGAPKLPRLLILPLFAALPTAAQQRVFDATPPFTRKIILATNIAETSVTVPGIRHVIDTGKRKARFFRPGLNLDTLLTKAISRSSANQRAGRAGREAAGNCYRLYTEKSFYELEADTEPEMLRCDLSQLVLILKSHNVDNILTFPLLTPPPEKSLKRALLTLLRLKALAREDGRITKLGQKMSALPLPANLARVLLASRLPQYDCLEEVIDIVSGLSVENIWLPIHNTVGSLRNGNSWTRSEAPYDGDQPNGVHDATTKLFTSPGNNHDDQDDEESQNPIFQARSTLYRREGDHLTLLAAIQAYAEENTDRKEWCRRHGTSHRAMNGAMDVRKQLRSLLIKSVPTKRHKSKQSQQTTDKPPPTNGNSKRDAVRDSVTKVKKFKDSDNEGEDDGDGDGDGDGDDIDENAKELQNPSTTTSNKPNQPDKSTRILRVLLLGLSDNVAYLSTHAPHHQPTSTSTTSKQTIWTGPYTTLSASTSSSMTSTPPLQHKTNTNTTTTSTSTNAASSSTGRKNLSIHPSSVLFSSPSSSSTFLSHRPNFIMFSEFVVTGRAYARNVSAIQAEWLDELLLSHDDTAEEEE